MPSWALPSAPVCPARHDARETGLFGGRLSRISAVDARSFLRRNGHGPAGRHPVASLLSMPAASCVATGTALRAAIRSHLCCRCPQLPVSQRARPCRPPSGRCRHERAFSPFPGALCMPVSRDGAQAFRSGGSDADKAFPAPAFAALFVCAIAILAFLLDFYFRLCHRQRVVDLTAMSRKEFPCHLTVPSLPVSRYLSRHADRLPCVHLPAGSASPARRSPCPVPASSCRLSPSTAPSVTGSSSGHAVMSCILPARPSLSWAGRP